jgi:CBS domain-containing protein
MEPDDPIREVMHGDVVALDLDASLREAVDLMAEQEVGSVIVTELGQLVGILTERDVITALWDQADIDSTRVCEIMSEEPYCAVPEDTVNSTMERMVQFGILHMPVVKEGRPVGMISSRDILRTLAGQERWTSSSGVG